MIHMIRNMNHMTKSEEGERDIDELIDEKLEELDDIIKELMEEKKSEIIKEKVQEELARLQSPENKTKPNYAG